ncbi:MAG: post-COAP-1 domain-containing protein [Chloroflexota bacterium]
MFGTHHLQVRRGAIGLVITAVLAASLLVASAASGAATFGAPFRLDNPSNPFGLGVQDVEPSIRVDTLGNVFPGAIRGVPAGVDLWRVYAPYDSAHYEYLGQPDGTPPIAGVGPGQDNDPGIGLGGGDIDIASSCETNLLNVSSLTLATTNNFNSADQGHSFTATEPSSASHVGVDRQWYDNDGPLTIYQSVHNIAAGNSIVVTRSTDGGLTWLPTTGQVINPAQPDAFGAALPFNNKLGNIVVDQHRHYLYQVYSAGATASDNVNGFALHAVWMAVSLDQGATWTDHLIYADPSPSMRTDNVFPVVAVDDAGNVYAVWSLIDSADASLHPGTFVSYSTDFGSTWSTPLRVNDPSQKVTLFPWIDAAGDGGVDIVYYGTTANTNDTGAVWNVFMAQSLNGHAAIPTFANTQLTGTGGADPIHEGNISIGGLQPSGSDDRSLADLFQVAIDYQGLANISWTADWYDRADPGNTGDGQAWFIHQTAGAIPGVPNDGCHAFNGGPPGGTGAKVSGGGWIAGQAGGKANFGFNEQELGGGNLTYVDKGADIAQFKTQTQTPPSINSTSASWGGSGTWTHADGSTETVNYQVTVVDNGQPGKTDRFSISFGSYTSAGQLGGGNITIH